MSGECRQGQVIQTTHSLPAPFFAAIRLQAHCADMPGAQGRPRMDLPQSRVTGDQWIKGLGDVAGCIHPSGFDRGIPVAVFVTACLAPPFSGL